MKRSRKILRVFVILVTLLMLAYIGLNVLVQFEQPAYDVELSEKNMELRNYHWRTVAEVSVSGERDAALDEAYRNYMEYIHGSSEGTNAGKAIPMTAPVTIQPVAEDQWIVRFFIPASYRLEDLPKPMSVNIKLVEQPEQEYGAVRFKGADDISTLDKNTRDLQDFLTMHERQPAGLPMIAYYDAPWVLPFMQHYEILFALAPEGANDVEEEQEPASVEGENIGPEEAAPVSAE